MSWAMISVILFTFMFSYYGSHGLGDSYRIPISHHNELRAIDSHAYIFIDDESNTYNIDKFVLTDDFVYGTLDKFSKDKKTSYFVFDLKSKGIKTFENESSYNHYLTSKGLDQDTERKEFNYYYNQYWNGWRFLLLP